MGEIACGGEIALRAVKCASTARGWILFHLRAKPEDFIVCRRQTISPFAVGKRFHYRRKAHKLHACNKKKTD
ncbi:MAG: hypothetical protein II738_00210 [Clostridia bacterium]|nr:hypothetical protein [Clostridia bacterium]